MAIRISHIIKSPIDVIVDNWNTFGFQAVQQWHWTRRPKWKTSNIILYRFTCLKNRRIENDVQLTISSSIYFSLSFLLARSLLVCFPDTRKCWLRLKHYKKNHREMSNKKFRKELKEWCLAKLFLLLSSLIVMRKDINKRLFTL